MRLKNATDQWNKGHLNSEETCKPEHRPPEYCSLLPLPLHARSHGHPRVVLASSARHRRLASCSTPVPPALGMLLALITSVLAAVLWTEAISSLAWLVWGSYTSAFLRKEDGSQTVTGARRHEGLVGQNPIGGWSSAQVVWTSLAELEPTTGDPPRNARKPPSRDLVHRTALWQAWLIYLII